MLEVLEFGLNAAVGLHKFLVVLLGLVFVFAHQLVLLLYLLEL